MIESFHGWGTMIAYGVGFGLLPFCLMGVYAWITQRRVEIQIENLHRKLTAGLGN